jgi:hypothetical protein
VELPATRLPDLGDPPWDLETHAAAEHPGWVARYELVRPLPNQHERVVYRRVKEPPTN